MNRAPSRPPNPVRRFAVMLLVFAAAVPAAAQITAETAPPPEGQPAEPVAPVHPAAGAATSAADPSWAYPPCPFAGTPPGHPPGVCHPYPQPRPKPSVQTTTGCPGEDCLTVVDTGEGIFPPANPFNYETFPGTNFLPTIYTDLFDGLGERMPNTLPSTPTIPYNLHAADPGVSEINARSPTDDLGDAFAAIEAHADEILGARARRGRGGEWTRLDEEELAVDARLIGEAIRFALDVIEGEPVAERAYSGFPLLHFEGPSKVKKVEPVTAPDGTVVGGNVDVHQVWYGQHIESDTAFVDPSAVLGVPWTITYTVDVLNRGHDDFSPFVTYTDSPAASPWIDKETCGPCPYSSDPERSEQCKQAAPMPNAGMDQTFFNMEDGTRTVFEIEMTPGKYLNLIYNWGWRMHPPRIQVIEKATKKIDYGCHGPGATCPADYQGCTLPQLEQAVFCNPDDPATPKLSPSDTDTCGIVDLPACTAVRCAPGEPRFDADGEPTQCERNKLYAIGRIGELAPAKRMWRALGRAAEAAAAGDFARVRRIVGEEVRPAFLDWQDRTRLPEGVPEDPDSDITIFYVNNTIYGELTAGGWVRWPDWVERPATLEVTAYNGDTWVHSYVIADFGGNRGWENQFKSSTKVAGSGCWFTFGRNYWSMPAGGPNGFLCVPPPAGGTGLGVHRFEVTFNYDPSRRLRFYQFDPFHHDVAIYSIH